MSVAIPGEVWVVDLGMAAKVRPCLVLTLPPTADELDVVTIVAHTTSPRGSQWEIPVENNYLDDKGAFDVQRIATVATVKLERRLGALTSAEFDAVLDLLPKRLGI